MLVFCRTTVPRWRATAFRTSLDGARPQDDLIPDAIAALVAGIDGQFDALRPLWLTVTVAFHAWVEGDPPRIN